MSPPIFASCRDCPSYLAFPETVQDLLLPVRTVLLPAETIPVILLPTESFGRKQNHMDSLCRKPFFMDGSLGRRKEITDSLGGSEN